MKVIRTSQATGITREMELDITDEQIIKYEEGALIQDAFPNLTPSERPGEGEAELPWIALLHVQLVREIGRLETEIEAADGMALVEHVAAPEVGGPAVT